MDCQLLSPTGAKFEGEVTEASMNTKSGQLGILPHHENIVEILTAGEVILHFKDGKNIARKVTGGVVEVENGHLHIMIDEPAPAHSSAEALMHAAFARAEQIHQDAGKNPQIEHASHLVDRGSVRLGVTRLRRHHRRSR